MFTSEELARIKIPIIIQFGEKELNQGRKNDRVNVYDRLRCPKYMMEIAGADHGTFTGGIRKEYASLQEYARKDPRRAAIARYMIAFFDYYLRDDSTAKAQLSVRGDSVKGFISSEVTSK